MVPESPPTQQTFEWTFFPSGASDAPREFGLSLSALEPDHLNNLLENPPSNFIYSEVFHGFQLFAGADKQGELLVGLRKSEKSQSFNLCQFWMYKDDEEIADETITDSDFPCSWIFKARPLLSGFTVYVFLSNSSEEASRPPYPHVRLEQLRVALYNPTQQVMSGMFLFLRSPIAQLTFRQLIRVVNHRTM